MAATKDVDTDQDAIDSALAEHIGESKAARTQQVSVNRALLTAQSTAHQKEIIAWLAPTAYDVDFYVNDLNNARTARHPTTCCWLLANDTFIQFSQTSLQRGALLWIYAQPGAGKTVLSAFLIDHLRKSQRPDGVPVLYFFCKNTDADKNISAAVIRSLLYQMYQIFRTQRVSSSLEDDLNIAVNESGGKRAVGFSTLWKIFSKHILDSNPITILIDALDEC